VTSGETQITRRSVGDVEVIELHGDVDFAIADDVREALCATGANVVIADLGSIDFIDSAGLRALDRAWHAAEDVPRVRDRPSCIDRQIDSGDR